LAADNAATEAVNCDLSAGDLNGLPQAEMIHDMTALPDPVRKAYRFSPDEVGDVVWLPLPDRFSQVVRSPLANDDKHRIYWTNPGDASPHWSTRERVKAGQPPFDLGIVQPTVAPAITSVTGGTTTVPAIDRVYTYTFIDSFGEESSPAPGSNLASGPPDATWRVNFPVNAPANPAGRAYDVPAKLRLYRVITSASSGAQFYHVTDFTFPTPGTFADTIPDSTVALNEILGTVGWGNPPDGIDGLVALTGGILAGFTNNTVHFTEPNRPHTWPSIYDQSVHFDIVTMLAWQQYLMVLTQGFPAAGTGNTPSNFIFVQSQAAVPCISRGSAVVDPSGVLYASRDGLVMFTGYQIINQTALLIEREEWINYYKAQDILAARHRNSYMAINETCWMEGTYPHGRGFIINATEARLGFEDLSTLQGVGCIWNDEETGEVLLMADKKVYVWDSTTTPKQTYRWKSKIFSTPVPVSLGAVQIDVDPKILIPPPAAKPPLDNGEIFLPSGVNAVFNYYAGPDLTLIMTRNLMRPQEIFRLPKGFKTFDHQVEIISRVPLTSIQLSTTLTELKKV
jgi:hypothetical protein